MANVFSMAFSRHKNPERDLENGGSQPRIPEPLLPVTSRPELSTDDQLNLFRHLAGIISHPSMSHQTSLFGSASEFTRPASNLGIYARVVHNEADAKRGFKTFSLLINGCLGVQLIVAAALTAMGAAGASRVAVTAFGAINTVIAGLLTFLKGSGLPMRYKYYQSEWKRVREFIEQRERDFSRLDCKLDLYGVVDMVESMYAEVKHDLEASQPDRFAGSKVPTDMSKAIISNMKVQPAITLPLGEEYKDLESTFGSKVKDIASQIGQKADEARAIGRDLQMQKDQYSEEIHSGISDFREKVEEAEHSFGDKIKDIGSDFKHMAFMAQDTATQFEKERTSAIRHDVDQLGERAAQAGQMTIPMTVGISFDGTRTALPRKE